MKFQGGCHCQKVQFEVELDLSQPAYECNCSHCAVKGMIMQFIPEEQFTLTSGADDLTEYRFNKETIAHQFCSTCGVQPFAHASGPDGIPMVAINMRTITDIDLDTVTRNPFNGKDL